MPTAYLAIGYSNSILSSFGAQAHERLWERTRLPGGALGNTVKLIHAGRDAGMHLFFTRYEIFRQSFPQSADGPSRSTTTGPPERRTGPTNRR